MLYDLNILFFASWICLIPVSMYEDGLKGLKDIKRNKGLFLLISILLICNLTLFSINRVFVNTKKTVFRDIIVTRVRDTRDNLYYFVDLDNGTAIILEGSYSGNKVITHNEDILVIEETKPKVKILNYDDCNLLTYKLYTKNK